MEKLLETFSLYDKNGRRYTAKLYQRFMDVSTSEGRGYAPGQKRYVLNDGTPLNPPDEGTDENVFKIATTGETLSRLPP